MCMFNLSKYCQRFFSGINYLVIIDGFFKCVTCPWREKIFTGKILSCGGKNLPKAVLFIYLFKKIIERQGERVVTQGRDRGRGRGTVRLLLNRESDANARLNLRTPRC